MKKILVILSLTLLVVAVKKLNASELTLRMFDNSVFDLYFNDEPFYRVEGSVTIVNITSERNFLKVFRYRSSHGHHANNPVLVFDGIVSLNFNSSIFAVIDRFGRFYIEREHPLYANPNEPPIYNSLPPYMSDVDFMHLKASIDRQSFDSSKLQLAKQAVSSNTMLAMQIRELMFLLSFESNKLELAKFAYPFTYDKNRYFVVNDAFSFSSSIRSLDVYISRI
ncbi:MAG: DUF4476 domain-containing protein [Bacteroidales bacterium]|nr:DUF4476 domain-containing protein [Bacteroidales bacterium]